MAVRFTVTYDSVVRRDDTPKMSATWKRKVRQAIETKLLTHPDVYGKPLRRSLKGFRKLRVGDYRVIFRIQDTRILVFAILHRSVVYDVMKKRNK